MLKSNDAWPIILIFAIGLLTFGSYLLFPGYLGYDSYFFLDHLCGGGGLYDEITGSQVPYYNYLAKQAFNVLPCDVFTLKLLFTSLFTISLLIIYYTSKLEHGKDAWMSIPFVLIFPVFLLNSLKIENDPLAYPLMFGSFYFFFKYLKFKPPEVPTVFGKINFIGFNKNYSDLFISLVLLFTATLFWGGSLYYLFYYSIFELGLLIIAVPVLLILFVDLVYAILPNFGVDENNPFRFVRQTMMFFLLFLLSNSLRSIPRNKWVLALPLLLVGLLSPKFLILLTPLIPLLLIHAWKNASELTKGFMVPLAVVVGLIYIIQIGISWHGPYDYEHDLVQEAIRLASDENKILGNDWGLGHLVFYYGGNTLNHSGISEINCKDCIVLSYEEYPWCDLLKEERKLKIYSCEISAID